MPRLQLQLQPPLWCCLPALRQWLRLQWLLQLLLQLHLLLLPARRRQRPLLRLLLVLQRLQLRLLLLLQLGLLQMPLLGNLSAASGWLRLQLLLQQALPEQGMHRQARAPQTPSCSKWREGENHLLSVFFLKTITFNRSLSVAFSPFLWLHSCAHSLLSLSSW